jgi:hypothetical protein
MSGLWPGFWGRNETNPKGVCADPDIANGADLGCYSPGFFVQDRYMEVVVGKTRFEGEMI